MKGKSLFVLLKYRTASFAYFRTQNRLSRMSDFTLN